MNLNKQYKLVELIDGLDDISIQGDPNCLIQGVCTLTQSQPGHITFLTNSLYRKYLSSTKASAVILSAEDAIHCPVNAIISKNPHFAYAKIASFFEVSPANAIMGIHPSAVLGVGCQIDPSAMISANVVIGSRVRIGANAMIGPGTIIGDDSEIGAATQLDARVTIYSQVKIGERTRIMSGAVVGSDGFGFAQQKGVWHKVPQLGGVSIGDDVDIGANTTIDRGAVEDTIIENGVKLDNLIQIAHNVKIGMNTIIAGCVGIAGSTIIGKNCMIGGATMIAGHVTITDKVMITGGTGVSKSIDKPGIYSSGIVGVVSNQEFRKNNARFHRLEQLMQRVKNTETTVKALKASIERKE